MKQFLLLFVLLITFSCTQESDNFTTLDNEVEYMQSPPCPPYDFEWDNDAKKFVVENLYLNHNHCQDEPVFNILFDVYLGSGVWEQFGFNLDIWEKKNDCIDYHFNNANGTYGGYTGDIELLSRKFTKNSDGTRNFIN